MGFVGFDIRTGGRKDDGQRHRGSVGGGVEGLEFTGVTGFIRAGGPGKVGRTDRGVLLVRHFESLLGK